MFVLQGMEKPSSFQKQVYRGQQPTIDCSGLSLQYPHLCRFRRATGLPPVVSRGNPHGGAHAAPAVTYPPYFSARVHPDTKQMSQMSIQDTRAGNSQSRQNENAFSLVMFEFILIAITVGVFTSSWVWGGLTFLLFLAVLCMENAGKAIAPLAAIAWGYLGYLIGGYFGGTSAAFVVGIIFFAISFGLHIQAFEHAGDLSRADTTRPIAAKGKPEKIATGGDLREVFRSEDKTRLTLSDGHGKYISLSVFIIGLCAMLFAFFYEPDPTRNFDTRSLQAYASLGSSDREIYQKLPANLRNHVNSLSLKEQGQYLAQWDEGRKKSCRYGRSQKQRSGFYYGIPRCQSKSEKELVDFALDHVFSR